MVSSRKQQANRTNAKRSTGPQTAEGKARASRNALGHGFAVPVTANLAFQAEIDQLARAILLSCGPGGTLELATRVAEAQVDLNRVRRARKQLICRALQEAPAAGNWQLALSEKLDDAALRKLLADRSTRVQIIRELGKNYGFGMPTESSEEREARRLDDIAKELQALERYESRALSRRKFAIRAFDAALSQPTETLAAEFEFATFRNRS